MAECKNCRSDHPRNTPCRVHEIARRAGKYDKLRYGKPLREARYPSGTWGHADYWLGYYVGTVRDTIVGKEPQ